MGSVDLSDEPFPLTAIDRQVLATKDEDFQRIEWDELRRVIDDNRLESLKRCPSDLRRYLAWSRDIKARYGGITNFVIKERLFWTSQHSGTASGPPTFARTSDTPFEKRRDYAVLASRIYASGAKCQRGDVTPESRKLIKDYVERYFVRALGGDGRRVMWFKNWVSLQSVRGVDHIHVLVREAPEALLKEWTMRKDL